MLVFGWSIIFVTPPKIDLDIKNDGVEHVSPLKHGYFRYYLYVKFRGCIYFYMYIHLGLRKLTWNPDSSS